MSFGCGYLSFNIQSTQKNKFVKNHFIILVIYVQINFKDLAETFNNTFSDKSPLFTIKIHPVMVAYDSLSRPLPTWIILLPITTSFIVTYDIFQHQMYHANDKLTDKIVSVGISPGAVAPFFAPPLPLASFFCVWK